MALDRTLIGQESRPESLLISRSRLRFFAKATGQTDPIYLDLDAAKQAGHCDLPVPPSFFPAIEMENPDQFNWLDALGVDLRTILHGEQQFTYHRMAYAGDELTARTTISDIYDKKNGALEFLVRTTAFTNSDDELIAEAISTTVIRLLTLS